MFKNFNGYWEEDLNNPNLRVIDAYLKKGEFYGVIGKNGSGKSGLLGFIID